MKRVRVDGVPNEPTDLVKINAGGKVYYTMLRTLTETFPNSLIACMFKRPEMIPRDDEGVYFIDADAAFFGALLNVLRRPKLAEIVPNGMERESWLQELDYWGIKTYVEVEEEEVTELIRDPMPETLVNRCLLFKEHCASLEKKLKRCDLIVVDRILECYGLDGIIGIPSLGCRVSSHLPPGGVYIDLNTETTRAGIAPAGTAYLDIVDYIQSDMSKFERLLKETMGFQTVKISLEPVTQPFRAFGKDYPKSKSSMLFISMYYNYHHTK